MTCVLSERSAKTSSVALVLSSTNRIKMSPAMNSIGSLASAYRFQAPEP